MPHIAQLNIARMLAPLDSPVMKDFVDNLDRINALAEGSPGFVWRLKDDGNNSTKIRMLNDDYLIVNLSVWKNVESLFDFVYKSGHVEIFKRRSEWFEKMTDAHAALWPVDEGHEPTVKEAEERILHLRTHGDSDYVYSLRGAMAKSAPNHESRIKNQE